MELKDTKNNLFLLTIVAIVAIVAIVIMIATTASRSYNLSEDTIGQAAKASASTDFVTEGKTTTDSKTTTTISSYCSDSDGGKNYYVRGTVEYSDGRMDGSVTDYCRNYNTSTLVEYYCNKGRLSQLDYTCENGCLNGACLNLTLPMCGNGIIEPGEQCDDGNSNNADQCNNQCMLTTCGDGIVQWPNGLRVGGIYQLNSWGYELCDDGNTNNNDACDNNCTVGRSCTDTDGGINYYTFGTVIFTNGTYSYNYTDYCSGNTTLYEMYCTGASNPATNTTVCPYGCSGGRCLNQTTQYDLLAQDIIIQGAYGNISIYTNGTYNYVYGNSQVILKPQVKNTGATAINAYTFYNRITFGSANGTFNTYTRCSNTSFWINPGITYTCNSDNVARTLLVGQPPYPISIGVDYYNNVSETNENNNARTEVIYVYP